MPEINSFIIDTSDLNANKTSRPFTVKAEPGSEFTVQVVNNSGAFYNWKTKSFNTGHIPQNNLVKKITSKSYTNNIVFPSSSSATYNVLVTTKPDGDTVFSNNITSGDKHVLNKSITQVGDVTLTFTAATANADSYGDPVDPTQAESPPAPNVSSTGSPALSGTTLINNTWDVYNKKDETNGFGLRLTREPIDTDWYFETTETVDGAVSGTNSVTVDDLTDLVVGMHVTGVSSGSLSGTPTITSINEATKTLTISSNQTFADGITLTFQARGWVYIKNAIGLSVTHSSAFAKASALSKTVRSGATSTNIELTDTYGVSGGSHVTVTGLGINTSGTNDINTVTQDFDGSDNDGVAVMDLSSTVVTGQTLHFIGSATRITINWNITIAKYPNANRTIKLNLDNFITPGTAT